MIRKNIANRIFQLGWIYFLITNIADFRLSRNLDLIPFIHVSGIPLIRFIPFLLIAVFLIPFSEIFRLFKQKRNLYIFVPIVLLLFTGYISSYLSKYPDIGLGVCNRISYYFVVLIFIMAGVGYFENARNFIIKSFIYSNVLVIAGSILDFYVPSFHNLLVSHFDRPQTFNSVVKLGGQVIMRPMGFLTDSNLTAFSLSISLIMLLYNNKQFNKIFRYAFYALSSYCIGMLASRASLVICIISFAVFYFTMFSEKKELYIFLSAFVIFQLITPQTYYRFYTLFDKKQNRMEFSTGRLLLWQTAFTVFKEYPLIGAGPGVFFELSDTYIQRRIVKNPDINTTRPNEENYFKIDKKNPHNIFLVILSETGIIGFTIFILLLILMIISYLNQKKLISLLFLINILIISFVSNFAPYYKFYLAICIVFLIASESNMKIENTQAEND